MYVGPPRGPARSPAGLSPYQRAARAALGLGLSVLALWTLQSFLPALVWGGIFAIATWPLYQRIRRRWPAGGHDVVIPALCTAAVALVFLLPLGLVAVKLGHEARSLFLLADETRRNGLPVPGWIAHLPFGSQQAALWWRDNLSDPVVAKGMLQRLNRAEVVSISQHVGSVLVHRIVLFGFTLLTLFFLFRDGAKLAEQMLRASHRAFGPGGERIGRQMIASVHGTLDGLVLVGLAEGVLLGVAYAVAGVPRPTLLGALTAVAATVPFGAPLIFSVAALLLLMQGAPGSAIGVIAFGFAVVFVADHFVRPVLIGGATRLPFLWVLLGILGGVEVWGLLGLFLGPAIMAALILLWREWTDPGPEAPPAP